MCVNRPPSPRGWALVNCVFIYLYSSAIVVIGVWFGYDFLPRQEYQDIPTFAISQPLPSFINSFASWDGVWYRDIVENGYSYNPNEGSYVVFFPGYPLLAWLISEVTGLGSTLSLLIVSHGCTLASLWLLRYYLVERFPDWSENEIQWSQLSFALSPVAFFLRMAYAESLFCLLVLLVLIGFQKRWPLWIVALIIGAATSVRLVGLALVAPLLFALYSEAAESAAQETGRGFCRCASRVGRIFALALLSAWGMLAYASFLYVQFGDATAFHSNHVLFNNRKHTEVSPVKRAIDLITLEPIRSVYVEGPESYWKVREPVANPLFTLKCVNPIYFSAVAVMILLGYRSRLVNNAEAICSLMVLAIPYVSKGYDNSMKGHARYALVAIPVYWIAGYWLSKCPVSVQTAAITTSACLMFAYAALFAAWFFMI